MCQLLNINRGVFYYINSPLSYPSIEDEVCKIFIDSRKNYGTRKIKEDLQRKYKIKASRRRIGQIMKKHGLISSYTKKMFKKAKCEVNQSKEENLVDRDFSDRDSLEVAVSDLTYVRVGNNWNYSCTIIDLFNREILGHSCGKNKDAALVMKAFAAINYPLDKIKIFHTDRGKEFDNKEIDEVLKVFNIKRSLSRAGTPYDNAVAEATYKVIKTEFINHMKFESLEELQAEFMDYVNWFNNERIHGSLGYLSPRDYRKLMSE